MLVLALLCVLDTFTLQSKAQDKVQPCFCGGECFDVTEFKRPYHSAVREEAQEGVKLRMNSDS